MHTASAVSRITYGLGDENGVGNGMGVDAQPVEHVVENQFLYHHVGHSFFLSFLFFSFLFFLLCFVQRMCIPEFQSGRRCSDRTVTWG